MSAPSAEQGGAVAARRFVDELLALDPRSPAYGDHQARLAATGRAELRASGDLSERIAARWTAGAAGTASVVAALRTIRSTLAGIDPEPTGIRRLMGRGDPDRVASRFVAARPRLEVSLRGLSAAVDALRRDVADADADVAALAVGAGALGERAGVLAVVDELLGVAAGQVAEVDEARATARRRRAELLTQDAVGTQAALAVTAVRDNAAALVGAADRARRVTGSLLAAADAAGTLAAVREALTDLDGAIGTAERGR